MGQVSFIHTADLHLDAPFTSLGDERKAEARRNDLENTFRLITGKAMVEGISLLMISGDFFEQAAIKSSTISMVKNVFSELIKTEIVILPGNHDPLRDNSWYRSRSWGSNVHILEDSRQVLYLEKYNTCIYNVGAKGDVKEDIATIKTGEIRNDRINILLFHGTVDMPFEDENYNAVTSEEISGLGMDYAALGHMHCFSRIQKGNTLMINPGCPEPLGFDEEGTHGFIKGRFIISDDNKKQIETEFIPCASRHYHNIDINIDGCSNDEEVISAINNSDSIKFSQSDLYSLTLRGFISRDYIPGIKDIILAIQNRCFYLKIKNQTSLKFDYEQYLEDPGLKGEFVRRIMDMQEAETDRYRRDTLFMALQYGLQAIENGRVD